MHVIIMYEVYDYCRLHIGLKSGPQRGVFKTVSTYFGTIVLKMYELYFFPHMNPINTPIRKQNVRKVICEVICQCAILPLSLPLH